MYIAAHLSPTMGLMSVTLVSFLMVVASANSECKSNPLMTEVPGSNKLNYTLSKAYDFQFTTGDRSDECGPIVFKCPDSLSLIFKSVVIKTKNMITFDMFNVVYMGMTVISFGGWNIPQSYGATDHVYTYTPYTLITGNGSIGVEVNIKITSLNEIRPETSVEILFQCQKSEPPLIASPWVPDESATFTNLFLIYVIPIVIFFLLFMMSIIHRCNPYAMAKLKSLGGFTAMDEEEIRNHAGGGTWHDHVDEIITDLKSRGVHEKRADKEEEEEMKGMVYSDKDSMSNSDSGSDPNNATRDSINMSNSEASQSIESEESEENSDEENSDDVNSDDL